MAIVESAHTKRRLNPATYLGSTDAIAEQLVPPYRGYKETFTITDIDVAGNSNPIEIGSMLLVGVSVVAVNQGSADATIDLFVQESDNGTNFADINAAADIALTNTVLFGRKRVDLYGANLGLRWTVTGTTKNWDLTITFVCKN